MTDNNEAIDDLEAIRAEVRSIEAKMNAHTESNQDPYSVIVTKSHNKDGRIRLYVNWPLEELLDQIDDHIRNQGNFMQIHTFDPEHPRRRMTPVYIDIQHIGWIFEVEKETR